MKKLFFLCMFSMMLIFEVHAATPQYSNVWRPIDAKGIFNDVRRNHLNGVGLEQTMTRALLQQKSLEYLSAVKAMSDAEPENATILAAYAWALATVKNSFTFASKSQSVPEKFSAFDFGWQNIRDNIQKAKELDSHCWLAYVAEATLEMGGPPPTKEAAALKKAFQIQRNPVTLTQYGSALVFQGAGSKNLKEQREGLRLLLLAEQLYPTYYKTSYETYAAYTYPMIGNREKSFTALKRFYLNVPPEYRHSPWVVRYLKYLGLEESLANIGVTL